MPTLIWGGGQLSVVEYTDVTISIRKEKRILDVLEIPGPILDDINLDRRIGKWMMTGILRV